MATRILTLALVLGAALQQATSRPNFAGEWVLAQDRSTQTMKGSVVVSVSGLLGEKFRATQDAKTLKLVINALGRELIAIYNLDGSESQNLNPGAPGQPDDPIYSHATWDGARLVIQTRGTALVNGKPQESKRVIWIDSEGFLTIERTAEGQLTMRSVYRRVQVAEP